MDVIQAIRGRHPVRVYTGKNIEEAKRRELDELIQQCDVVSGRHIQIRYDDLSGGDSKLVRHGRS